MVKDIGHVIVNIYALPMYQLHAIQQVAVEEMKTIEWEIYGQLKTSKKTILSLKQTIKETENKDKTQKDDRK